MTNRYTQGPWVTHPDGIASDCGMPDYKIIGPNLGRQVCHVYVDDEQDLANAHLIAAAPDLLEALASLFNLANHFNVSGVYFTDDDGNREALEAAEVAIAKAKGEQP